MSSEVRQLFEVASEDRPDLVCESCGSDRMVLISETVKPSWRAVLGYGSATAPNWYAALRDESDRAFWDDAMGEGFNAGQLPARNTFTWRGTAVCSNLNHSARDPRVYRVV